MTNLLQPGVPRDLERAYTSLTDNVRAVFGPRLIAVVAFGPALRWPAPGRRITEGPLGDALALVDRVGIDDLIACAAYAPQWRRDALHMPLLLGHEEFLRSLDAFPLEYDDIIAHHVLLTGDDPFRDARVPPEDLRRACEARAKGHLIHLREGFLEARGRADGVSDLILASVSPFSALLGNLARLEGRSSDSTTSRAAAVAAAPGVSRAVVDRILGLESHAVLPADEAEKLYLDYLATVQAMVAWVDRWARS